MQYGISKPIKSVASGVVHVYPFKVKGKENKQYLQLDFSSESLFKSMTSDLELRSLLNTYVNISISDKFPLLIEYPRLELQLKIKNEQFTIDTLHQELRDMFEKENIKMEANQKKAAYSLEVSATSISNNNYNIKSKLTSPTGEIVYSKARILKIDDMVYNTKQAITKLLVNSFKRRV